MADGDRGSARTGGGGLAAGHVGQVQPRSAEPADLSAATEALQRTRVEEALRIERGNRAAAARRLGMSKQWLHRLLTRWGREGFAPAR